MRFAFTGSVIKLSTWKEKARELRREVYALSLAYRNPKVPWYGKVLAGVVVAYAFSPIDLIPDPIPLVGYLDDVILVPLGIYICLKMIPKEVMDECRTKAELAMNQKRPTRWLAAVVIISIWLVLAWMAIRLILGFFGYSLK